MRTIEDIKAGENITVYKCFCCGEEQVGAFRSGEPKRNVTCQNCGAILSIKNTKNASDVRLVKSGEKK